MRDLVGLGRTDDCVQMLSETIPDGDKANTWIDFKYIKGRNIWGLNKPAVFSKAELKKLFALYTARTGVPMIE
jgi:hypothetical protein